MYKRMNRLMVVLMPAFLTAPAYANAGTPLMWAGGLHLVFGNLLIGIGEGLLLGFVFRVPKVRAICLMILANYFSAVTAFMILNAIQSYIDTTITLYEIQWFIWAAYAAAFVYTVLVEAPFVYFAVRQKRRPIVSAALAAIVVQIFSYAGILYVYYGISYDSLFRNAHIVRNFESKNAGVIYYLGADRNVYRMHLDGTQAVMVYEPSQKQELMNLYLQQFKGSINLCLGRAASLYSEYKPGGDVIIEHLLSPAHMNSLPNDDNFMDEAEAVDFRPAADRQWNFSTGFWAAEGLLCWNKLQNNYYSVALETPFAQWYARSATVLPGDEVVFQLGQQVCLYSRQTKEITRLAKGISPVVVPEGAELNDELNHFEEHSNEACQPQASNP